MPGGHPVPAKEVMLEQQGGLLSRCQRASRRQRAGNDGRAKITPVELMEALSITRRQPERRLEPAQRLQAQPAAAECPAHPVLERPGEPGVGVIVRARLVQVRRDDLADRVLPDLVGPGAPGMLFPFLPVRSGMEHELPEMQASSALATCVSFALGHWMSSASCDSHATGDL